jgi:hypothetical protein
LSAKLKTSRSPGTTNQNASGMAKTEYTRVDCGSLSPYTPGQGNPCVLIDDHPSLKTP